MRVVKPNKARAKGRQVLLNIQGIKNGNYTVVKISVFEMYATCLGGFGRKRG
jgi:hypothetical protein